MGTALPEGGGVDASPLTRSSPSSRVCLREPAKGRGRARGRLAGLLWQRGLRAWAGGARGCGKGLRPSARSVCRCGSREQRRRSLLSIRISGSLS